MEMVESGDEEPRVTQEELDDMQKALTERLGRGVERVSQDVQYGILTELPGLHKILSLFSRTASEGRTAVHEIPSDAANKMLGHLQRMPPRNVFQEIYTLCFVSTLVHDVNGTTKDLQRTLQKLLGSILPRISEYAETGVANAARGKWELVWGPVVWKVDRKDDSGGPDLAWYIAYNDSVVCWEGDEPRPTYVIAIAGTQTRSVHTWINSNFDVTTPIDFKSWVSGLRSDILECKLPEADVNWGSAYIARGTARTVWQLLTVKSPRGAEAEGQTLLSFLKRQTQSNLDVRLITTGHSLGGALSPTLALVLVELDVVLRDRILTYPIAGPSPGNEAFATLFSETFLPITTKQGDLRRQKYRVWNHNLVNAYDPVPQAWCSDEQASPKQNLRNIDKIIPGSLLKSVLSAIISSVLGDLSGKRLRYMPLRSRIFSAAPSESVKDVRSQHTQAYHEYVGVTPPDLQEVLC